jgi:hypothetical protein
VVIDALDPGEGPARAFVVGGDKLRVAALVDGSDWGISSETADFTRDLLRRRWTRALPDSADQVSTDLREAVGQVLSPRDPSGQVIFSAVVLLCRPEAVSMVASGGYAVRLICGVATHFLFRPRRLGDEMVRQGNLSPAEAATFPHRDIFTGPFLGVSDELFLAHRATRPGDRLIASNCLQDSSAGANRHPSPTIVVTW